MNVALQLAGRATYFHKPINSAEMIETFISAEICYCLQMCMENNDNMHDEIDSIYFMKFVE